MTENVTPTSRRDVDIGDFHTALGFCITAFSKVEKELFDLCHTSMKTSAKYVTAIVYFRTPTINSRLDLVDELVKFILPKTDSGKPIHKDLLAWQKIVADIKDNIKIRNRLAHHPVSEEDLDDTENSKTIYVMARSTVSEAEALREKHEKQEPLYFSDVAEYHNKFMYLSGALYDFHYNLLQKHIS